MDDTPEPVTYHLCRDCGAVYPLIMLDCPDCRAERADDELYRDEQYTREINRP